MSTNTPTQTDESAHNSPSPTADAAFEHGCTLTRREAIQTAALAAAATVGTAGATGSVAAEDDNDENDHGLVSGIYEAIADATNYGTMAGATTFYTMALSPFVGAIYLSDQLDDVNEEPTADREILHQLVHTEISKLNAHLVNFGNYLHDTPSVASLEARHGMASAWENGDGSTTGYDVALQRIRQYYELPEFNHLHAGNLVLLQLSYIAGAGQDTDPEYEIIASGEDADEEFVQVRITDEREDVDLELHDGTPLDEDAVDELEHTDGEDAVFRTPVLEFRADDEETVLDTSPITQDVLESFDPDDGEVTFDLEDGEYTTDLRFIVPNVGDANEDPALGSQLAFDGREWLSLWHDLVELSDEVAATYDLSFVEDIYAELDAGNLTPEQVRSPEGMARFLSGTDDPSSERFQIAWMQQFGLERPDLTQVRGMEIEWTGATESWVDPDPNLDDRHVHPEGYVTDETYSGVLFGTRSGDQFDTGGVYAVDPLVYCATAGSPGNVEARSLFDNTKRFEIEVDRSDAVATSDEHLAIFKDTDGTIALIDLDDPSERVEIDVDGHECKDLQFDETGDFLYYAADGGSTTGSENSHYGCVDVYQETLEWSESLHTNAFYSLAFPNDDELLVAHWEGVSLADRADGEELEELHEHPSRSVTVDRDRQIAYFTSDEDGLVIYDLDAGEVVDTLGDGFHDEMAIQYDPHNDLLYTGGKDDRFRVHEPDGTELGNYQTGKDSRHINPLLGTTYVHVSGDYDGWTGRSFLLDVSDPSRIDDLYDGVADEELEHRDAAFHVAEPVDGLVGRAIMFDESDEDGDGEGQIDLWNGVLEVVDMWDADGATIEHVDEDTIEDIEEIVDEDIEDVIDDMDEFDDVDDIRFRRDVELILEYYGHEDEIEDVHLEEPEYSSPEYDTFDSGEFADAMEELEEYIDQLEDEDEDDGLLGGGGGGWPDLEDGDTWLGIGLFVAVLAVIAAVATNVFDTLFGGPLR